MGREAVLSLALICCGALLGGCGKQSAAPAGAGAPADGTGKAGPTLPFAGSVMSGGNTEALRTYLRSVQEIPARKFAVQWTPATVKIDRDAALRSLLAVSGYGDTYTFDSSEPALAQLRPGSILFIWGVALRKVTAVEPRGKVTIVTTGPAALQEAIANGEIEIAPRVSLRNYLVVPRKPLSSAQKSANRLRHGGFMLAAYEPAAEGAPDEGGAVEPRAVAQHRYEGEFKGFDYSLEFVPGDEGLAFDLQLRKEEDGTESTNKDAEDKRTEKQNESLQESAEKQRERAHSPRGEAAEKPKSAFKEAGKKAGALFEIASDMLDLRVKADGVLQGVDGSDNLVVLGRLVFKDGAVALLQSRFENISGTVNVQYIVRRGELSSQWIEKLRLDLPLTFNVPIVVGGLPLMVQFGFDLMATPALATRNDAFRGAFTFKFGGSGGTQFAAGKPSADAQMNGEGEARDAQASSIGVSAVLIALQAPRIGLGVGLFGMSTIGYIDMVTATSVTSAGTLGMLPCREWDSYWTMSAGIDAQVGMFEKDFRTDPPLLKKEWHKVDPPIKGCQLEAKPG